MVINVNRYGFVYGESVGIFRGMQYRGLLLRRLRNKSKATVRVNSKSVNI
jgi:hypothetical protein